MSTCIYCGRKVDFLIDDYCEDCFNSLNFCASCGEQTDDLDEDGMCYECRREMAIERYEGYRDAFD